MSKMNKTERRATLLANPEVAEQAFRAKLASLTRNHVTGRVSQARAKCHTAGGQFDLFLGK